MRAIPFFLIILFVISCNRKTLVDPSENEKPCEFTIDVAGVGSNECTVSLNQPFVNESFVVIRNQESLDTLVSLSGCPSDIDFEAYDLIVGIKGLTAGLSHIERTYHYNCNNLEQELQVNFYLGMTTEAPTITYSALIPKLLEAESVSVEYLISYQ